MKNFFKQDNRKSDDAEEDATVAIYDNLSMSETEDADADVVDDEGVEISTGPLTRPTLPALPSPKSIHTEKLKDFTTQVHVLRRAKDVAKKVWLVCLVGLVDRFDGLACFVLDLRRAKDVT